MTAATPWQTQYSSETRIYGIDMALDMDPGDVLGSTATANITDLLTGVTVTGPPMLPFSPSVSGTVITQEVTGLTPGHNYRLMVLGSMGGVKVTGAVVNIGCPY